MFTLEVRADVALRAAWLHSGVLGSRNLRVHGTLEALRSGLLVHLFRTPADLNAGHIILAEVYSVASLLNMETLH